MTHCYKKYHSRACCGAIIARRGFGLYTGYSHGVHHLGFSSAGLASYLHVKAARTGPAVYVHEPSSRQCQSA